MTILRPVLVVGLLVALAPVAYPEPNPVPPALRQQSVATLHTALGGGAQWVNVHAAEDLLALGYREGVRDTFEAEHEAHGDATPYRIGIWRVLARLAYRDANRAGWLELMKDVLYDDAAPDRVHALESLAKLGWGPGEEERAAFDAAADALGPEAAPFASWALLNAGDATPEDLLPGLDAPSWITRARTAYVLRSLATVPESVATALADAAGAEAPDSPARPGLVAAAYVHARDEAVRETLKPVLLALLEAGDTGGRRAASAALYRSGVPADLPALEALLDSGEAALDARAGAAAAVLAIGRRTRDVLSLADWAVVLAYALGMVGVGWYYLRRTRSAEDYLLGGRQMRPWAVGLSLFATLLSTLTYLAIPGEMIKNGPMYLTQAVAWPVVFVIIGWLFLPFIMSLRVTSAYEILQARFGTSVRMLASCIFLLLRILWMASIVYATTDKALIPLTGLSSAWTPWICAVLAVITLVYTSMGGLRAVVFTDVAQTFVLFAGAVLGIVIVTVKLGGVGAWWPETWYVNWEAPQWGFEPGARLSFGWLFLSTLLWYVSTNASDQMSIQRFLATRDLKAARRVMGVSLSANFVVFLLLGGLGLALLAWFRAHPHLLGAGQDAVTNADEMLPRFMAVSLPAGLSGLVLAALLAAAMSSLSSGMNSASSVITVDFIDRFRRTRMDETEHVRMARWASAAVGLVVVVLSFSIQYVPGNLFELCYRVVNLFTVPLFILFFMAMFVPWATVFGTWAGTLASAAAAVVVSFWDLLVGSSAPSFLWIMPAAMLAGVVVGPVASLLPVGPPAAPPLPRAPAPE